MQTAKMRGSRAQLIRIDWQDAESRLTFEPGDPLIPETVYALLGLPLVAATCPFAVDDNVDLMV